MIIKLYSINRISFLRLTFSELFTIGCKSPNDRLLLGRELCGRMPGLKSLAVQSSTLSKFSIEVILFTLDHCDFQYKIHWTRA